MLRWFVTAFSTLAVLKRVLFQAKQRGGQKKKSPKLSKGSRSDDPSQLSAQVDDKDSTTSASETDDTELTPKEVDTVDLPSGGRLRLTLETLPPEGQPGQPETLYQTILETNEEVLTRAITPTITKPSGPSIGDRLRSSYNRLLSELSTFKLPEPIPTWWTRLLGSVSSVEVVLFVLSLIIYAATRLIDLESFPIYFFTDEAVQTVLASDFIRDGFRDYNGILFPTYFQNSGVYNLSLSVYVQVIPYLLFGKSVFVTRATIVLITLTGAAAVGLTLKEIFRSRFWWAATLLLSITPVWFLHSRTAFETVLFASLFAWVIYFYLLYRTRSPRFLYPTLLFAGLAFYSYSAGQVVIAATGILLLFSDLRYHWQNRKSVLIGLAIVLLFALPYIRFQLQFSDATYYALRRHDAYWYFDIPLAEKIRTFIRYFSISISPDYWYFPNSYDLVRHLMKGYGHIMLLTLPFAILGLIISIRNYLSSEHRVILFTFITSPLGGTIAGIGVTRMLAFVIPAAILTAIGVDAVCRWFARRISQTATAIILFAILAVINIRMLMDVHVNSSMWYRDYTLGGMQYGAQQVFGAVESYQSDPTINQIFVSPTWANGTGVLQRFFLPDDTHVRMGNADPYFEEIRDLDDSILFVLTKREYEAILENRKVTDIQVEQTLPYPDGTIGFYFVRMRYSPEAAVIIAEELEARRRPIDDEIMINDQLVQIQHPLLDIGEVENLFDDDTYTLVRTYDANPALIILTYSQPPTATGLRVTTGSMDFSLTVRLYTDEKAEPITYSQSYTNLPDDPTVDLPFDEGPIEVKKIEIEIFAPHFGTPAKIHIRELTLY
jgi:hypothetical protein